MPQSLSKVFVHITYSTRNREKIIDDSIQTRLFKYTGGICKGLDCNPLIIGGYTDHIHVLCTLSRKITQAQLLEKLKKESSKWIKTIDKKYENFYWQSGYGIFSVKPSEVEIVKKYIINQKEHHERRSFQDEYRVFLKKYRVEYDEKYVWD